ncbi:MAG: class I SAM-dependent methyltransferase [Planctomycetota bacterium]
MTTQPLTPTTDYFESIYVEAHGDRTRIPWADGRPSPALVNWLNAVAPSLVRCGSRVAVVGCGLGDDAREIIRRGYDVTAFDCSHTAVDWARRLDPINADAYLEADLFDPPARWRHRFDLVVEINTLQSLAPDRHLGAMSAIADLVAPHGHLLVIARAGERPAAIEDGPPWPLTEAALVEAAGLAGLAPHGPACVFEDDEDPPVLRLRAAFRRA